MVAEDYSKNSRFGSKTFTINIRAKMDPFVVLFLIHTLGLYILNNLHYRSEFLGLR